MKTKHLITLGCLMLHAAFCLSGRAQGTAFTYQGRLNDGANPATGIYDLRFAIYDLASAGTQQGGTLTNSATAVTNGLFTVTLDFGNQFPGPDRWLEIGVRANGGGAFTTLNPRQPLTPAPYAIYAGSSATLATTNSQPLNLTINGTTVLRIESVFDTFFGSYAVNSVGGFSGNVISNGLFGSFIGGGGHSTFPNRVGGDYSSVLGGLDNTASGQYSSAMGFHTRCIGFSSTTMGNSTTASGNSSTAMGAQTTASGFASTAMGYQTIASGDYSTAMGYGAAASGGYATAMGSSTTASGIYATAMGEATTASSDHTFAAGKGAVAKYPGVFVWADTSFATFDPFSLLGPQGVPNSFNVRSTGGFYIASGVNPADGSITAGVQLIAGSGTWGSYSDRNAKANFQPVNSLDVLEKLVHLPLETWNYKAQAERIRHIGPMAQDFAAAFNVGDDNTHITTVDADGVALAAIQGLNEKLEARSQKSEVRSQMLEKKLHQKEREIAELKMRLERIEQLLLNQTTKEN